MAQAQNYYPSQNVSVWYQAENVVGTQVDDTGLTKLQTTSFTIPEASVPVEYSSPRNGQFTTTATQGHHAEGTKLWTFDTTLRGTPASVLLATRAVFEAGSSEAILYNNYSFPTANYKHGADNSSATPKTFDIRFEDAGSDDTNHNVVCAGCVGTGFTLTQDIASEGGELVCTINWATAYMPNSVEAGDDAIDSPQYDTGTPKNIRNLNAATTLVGSEEVVVSSWELGVTRTIERIHFRDTTSGKFDPFGYAMVGGYEVTGSINAIRNDSISNNKVAFRNGATVDINIAESSNFTIALDKCYLNEPSIDNGGAVLMQTIPFTVVGADDISSATKMLGITIA